MKDSRKKPLVSFENKLHFAKSYLYLLQAHFGANLKVVLDISTDDLDKSLLYNDYALQAFKVKALIIS
ncbi:MAG: hypothetical protein ACUVRP_08000 [Chlorobiales bacterium]